MQDDLAPVSFRSPTRASKLTSFEQKELHISILDSFDQLDLEISLSFPQLGSTSFSYQLQADSFDRISFQLRDSFCAALLYNPRIRNRSGQSLQLEGIQLGSLIQGGAFNIALQIRASRPPLHCTASTLTSLSLALSAWLKPSSKTAWRSIAWIQSLFPTSLSTTSSHKAASMRALQPTSFRTTSSFRTTLSWFSFLFHNFFFSSSFRGQEIEKEDELLQTVLEQELGEHNELSAKPFQQDQLQQNLYREKNKNNKLDHNQLQEEQVPDRELRQLHLHQLCLQDPASAISRQLPEEPLSASGLQTAAWPAAVQIDKLSFSKQKLSEQDLSNISLDRFFPENFGKQLSEQQLQTNLSTDQRQLQNNQLHKNTFQQLSLEHPSFTEKILHKELATTFAKNSFKDNLVFQNLCLSILALQKAASEQLGENNLYKKQLAKAALPRQKKKLAKNSFSQLAVQQPA